ncbi:hypothetical protein [Endozoicomonas sp. ONNA1]|uniref:hypothetical protein n=1 Tax=Endozoicomonas sp. ONNA1 TaxID=2828740 RepID=UPI0021495684|nr:hypothetical protein [Endozoicomonas sp. ONNA1]
MNSFTAEIDPKVAKHMAKCEAQLKELDPLRYPSAYEDLKQHIQYMHSWIEEFKPHDPKEDEIFLRELDVMAMKLKVNSKILMAII